MRFARHGWLGAVLLIVASRTAFAQTLSVSGNPGLLRINSAVAGSQPISVSNAATTYRVITPNNPNVRYKITARLNAPMPAAVTLTGTFAAPANGAISLGPVVLDATSRDVVTNIRRNTNVTRGITYQLSATVAAGVVPNSSRTVTLTVLQSP